MGSSPACLLLLLPLPPVCILGVWGSALLPCCWQGLCALFWGLRTGPPRSSPVMIVSMSRFWGPSDQPAQAIATTASAWTHLLGDQGSTPTHCYCHQFPPECATWRPWDSLTQLTTTTASNQHISPGGSRDDLMPLLPLLAPLIQPEQRGRVHVVCCCHHCDFACHLEAWGPAHPNNPTTAGAQVCCLGVLGLAHPAQCYQPWCLHMPPRNWKTSVPGILVPGKASPQPLLKTAL